MIYRADNIIINYLISSWKTGRDNKYTESTKDEGNYILIDYFDWLDYIIKTHNSEVTINTYSMYMELYSTCKELIEILSKPLTSESINKIVNLNTKVFSFTGKEKSKIDLLCEGYNQFKEEILNLQYFYLKMYEYNNFNFPILLVPFSYGLNRLSSGHIMIHEYYNDLNLLDMKIEYGKIKDPCQRSILDFGIRTYTFFRTECDEPYNLPLNWHLNNSVGIHSKKIASKMKYVVDCYSQYCYTGFFNPTDIQLEGNRLFFLINYPFLLNSMSLTLNYAINDEKFDIRFIKG